MRNGSLVSSDSSRTFLHCFRWPLSFSLAFLPNLRELGFDIDRTSLGHIPLGGTVMKSFARSLLQSQD